MKTGRPDWFLGGILIGIGVVVAAALILFFLRDMPMDYVDDSRPEGVCHNYILALQRQDYQKAYEYLLDSPDKPSFEVFMKHWEPYQEAEIRNYAVAVGEARITEVDQTAIVSLIVTRSRRDPFDPTDRWTESAGLVNQNGVWKLTSMPYPFWDYGWSINR
jgi:hypothetical protein